MQEDEDQEGYVRNHLDGALGFREVGAQVGCSAAHACNTFNGLIARFLRAYEPRLTLTQALDLAKTRKAQYAVRNLVEKALERSSLERSRSSGSSSVPSAVASGPSADPILITKQKT